MLPLIAPDGEQGVSRFQHIGRSLLYIPVSELPIHNGIIASGLLRGPVLQLRRILLQPTLHRLAHAPREPHLPPELL